jgi:hypothetical protein
MHAWSWGLGCRMQWHSQVSRGIRAQYIADWYPHIQLKTQHRRLLDFDHDFIIFSRLFKHYYYYIIPTSNAYHPINKHVFTSYSIRLRTQPSWRPNAQDPHRRC